MGKEAQCTCRWNKQTSTGKALLETAEIIFRGDFRLAIALKEIKSVEAVDGELRIDSPLGRISLALGPAAVKWADRILHPLTRIDKLGVKPGSSVSIIGLDDAEFMKELAAAKADVALGEPSVPRDLLFFAAENRADLKRLRALKASIKSSGAVWVVYPKGIKTITEADVLMSGREAGLVDVKVARYSDRLTALKFVIPVSKRN